MIIDGTKIALEIKKSLQKEVSLLQKNRLTPQLAIVFNDTDDSIRTYIRQKQKLGLELGIKVTLIEIKNSATRRSITDKLNKLNKDPDIHGIIIQRPFPLPIPEVTLKKLVIPQKDVDGFYPKSCCEAPIALSVYKILEYIRQKSGARKNLYEWLSNKKILIIGRGESGGAPLAEYFRKNKIYFYQAHSQTKNINELISESDIIISCVGKPNIVRHDIVKSTAILIGIGLYRQDGKLQTDYDQEKIAKKVAFYTPAPGGVGPVNVSYLFYNLIQVMKLSSSHQYRSSMS
ncbi:bifunctional 5,10-methylenetetrahydrofolate dehydrogenase/5,10-methenyltetrahydrofolate cyclohydrolase [Candidatus Gottesmanbacteria bacterium]|nr:bifunctional 5,10-methylenetetrahydrofolate dehydrogenase/5,10-methenyltetrahydrofolate cyclohydrolase [Candidatus Gottesmanbacteria bacterium]